MILVTGGFGSIGAHTALTLEESARLRRRYEEGLNEYTYLTRSE